VDIDVLRGGGSFYWIGPAILAPSSALSGRASAGRNIWRLRFDAKEPEALDRGQLGLGDSRVSFYRDDHLARNASSYAFRFHFRN
jgi:hypothetical protein